MRIKKMFAMLTIVACGFTMGTGNSGINVEAAKNTSQTASVQRRPLLKSYDSKTGKTKKIYLDTGKVKGVKWNAKKKTLTIKNFKCKGEIFLDYFNGYYERYVDSYNPEEKAHLKDTINVVVKGNCAVNGSMSCNCNMKISGNGKLSITDTATDIMSYYEFYYDDFDFDYLSAIHAEGNLNIKNVTLNTNLISCDKISFNNVKASKTFKLRKELDHTEAQRVSFYYYEPYAMANQISINNSKFTFNYMKPTDKQINKNIVPYDNCMRTEKLNLKNSKINIKGTSETLKNVALRVFDLGNESDLNISSLNTKMSGVNFTVGQSFSTKYFVYKVTKVENGKVPEVEIVSYNANKGEIRNLVIPESVRLYGKDYRITSIGRKAFSDCTYLENVKFENEYITSIGEDAFATDNEDVEIKYTYPESKKKEYEELVKKSFSIPEKFTGRPYICDFKELSNDDDDVTTYLDTGNVKGVTWKEETRELFLENYKATGTLYLYPEVNENKNEKDLLNTVTIHLKGDNVIDGSLNCDCNLVVDGDGTLTVEDSRFKEYDNFGHDSIYVNGDMKIENATIKSSHIRCSNTLTFKNAKVYMNYIIWYDLWIDDPDEAEGSKVGANIYSGFAEADTINIINSKMEFKYQNPTKSQLKDMDVSYPCFRAENFNVSNSDIQFKGSNNALKYVIAYETKNGNIDNSIKYVPGLIISDGDYSYRVKSVGTNKLNVAIHSYYPETKKNNITIKNTTKLLGQKLRITEIEKKAFASNPVSVVNLKNKYIKKIGKNAFVSKNGNKITFKVIKSRKKKYTKLLKKAGIKNFVVK